MEDVLLASEDPANWTESRFGEILELLGPARELVFIEGRIGPALRARIAPDDIWQEAVWHAWRDRHQLTWRGLSAFRAWLHRIVENRIRDAAEREGAQARGGGQHAVELRSRYGDSSAGGFGELMGAVASTTPERLAILREQADAICAALDELNDELSGVLRLRHFEGLPLEEVADRLGISLSTAKRRWREAATVFQSKLRTRFGDGSMLGFADS